MTLAKVDFEELVNKTDGFSGAELKAVATEAGYFAIRDNRTKITHQDFISAMEKVVAEVETEGQDYLKMFG